MVQPQVVLRGVHRGYATGPLWRRQLRPVLRGVDLVLGAGSALTVRGENGAGKSTLLRLLAGLLTPSAGSVEVCGQAPHQPRVRARIGFASGDARGLFQRLTGRQNLEFFAALHGLADAETRARLLLLDDELLLGEALDRRVDQCSAGMQARLSLARALLHEPAVLLLDEPFKSLDARRAQAASDALRRRVAAGLTLVVVTHFGADAVCSLGREVVLEGGRFGDVRAPSEPARETEAV